MSHVQRTSSLCAAAWAVALSVCALPVEANGYQELYAFHGKDGHDPQYPLVMYNGDLYGTTDLGGGGKVCTYGCGTVFKLTPSGTETVLYSFTGANDGAYPAGIIIDKSGTIYGVANAGGGGSCNSAAGVGCGTVFRLTPDGTLTALYAFQGGASDGSYPNAGMLMGKDGALYGTAGAGGNGNCSFSSIPPGCGIVFKIDPDGREKVLHIFEGGSADGSLPFGTLVADKSGNMYGSTLYGSGTGCGGIGCGIVFKLSPGGTETILYSFCAKKNCRDGAEPGFVAPLLDTSGNIYGTTVYGGSGSGCGDALHCGTVFELAADGTATVLHSFCAESKCTDGYYPYAGVIADKKGNLYATTTEGGSVQNSGTVFELTPDGAEKVLHSFAGGSDGAAPEATLIQDRSGNLYGTTYYGGRKACSDGCGTVFKVTE